MSSTASTVRGDVSLMPFRHDGRELPLALALVHERELAGDENATAEFLCADELEAWRGLRFPARRRDFLIGRLAAKKALAALLAEQDLHRIRISNGVFGQPLVQYAAAHGLGITLSHNHGVAVAVAHPEAWPAGVDLERISRINVEVMPGEMELGPAESTWLRDGGIERAVACAVLWTAREALGKLLKSGFGMPLGELALDEIHATGAATFRGRYGKFRRCQCLSVQVNDRLLTLALPADVQAVNWPPRGTALLERLGD